VVNTKLLFQTKEGNAKILDNYKPYWFSSLSDFAGEL
jgi:hypothetical protein